MSFFAYFKEEFQVIQERDPAIHSPMEVLLYPSFRVMLKYRRALGTQGRQTRFIASEAHAH